MSESTISTPELRNASSRSRCSSVAKSNSVMVNVRGLGRKVTSVPRLSWAAPTTASGASASPSRNSMKCCWPSRQMVSLSHVDSALTTREREIESLIVRGDTNREIAASLSLSERTVDTHVSRILRKYGLSSRTLLMDHRQQPGPSSRSAAAT